MRKQKDTSYFATKLVVAFLMTLSMVGGLYAGSEKRISGTVKTVGNDSVTVETASHKLQTIMIGSKTKFLKHNKPSSLSEMKTGDHVVFTVKPVSSAAQAETATATTTTKANNTSSSDCSGASTISTTTSPANTQKDSLSLGLSFCAVQASY